MAVPEAAVNKDNKAVLGEDEVRPSREILAVEPEAKAHTARDSADRKLRPGVLAADLGHVSAAGFGRKLVQPPEPGPRNERSSALAPAPFDKMQAAAVDHIVMDITECGQVFSGVGAAVSVLGDVVELQEFTRVVKAKVLAAPAAERAREPVPLQHHDADIAEIA